MARIDAVTAGGKNRVAFLDMTAVSEIGTALLKVSDDGYNVLVGSTAQHPELFSRYVQHPNIYNSRLGSTAAGRYQILARYWDIYQKRLNLPDFSPISQDRYVLQQLKEQGALPLIDSGDLQGAIEKCNNIWASFPGSPYGQNTHPYEFLKAAYVNAGGTLKLA